MSLPGPYESTMTLPEDFQLDPLLWNCSKDEIFLFTKPFPKNRIQLQPTGEYIIQIQSLCDILIIPDAIGELYSCNLLIKKCTKNMNNNCEEDTFFTGERLQLYPCLCPFDLQFRCTKIPEFIMINVYRESRKEMYRNSEFYDIKMGIIYDHGTCYPLGHKKKIET